MTGHTMSTTAAGAPGRLGLGLAPTRVVDVLVADVLL